MYKTEFFKMSAVIGAIVFAPAVCAAAESCVSAPAVPGSYMWGSSQQASILLANMSQDAQRVGDEAAVLENRAASQENAPHLQRIKEEVNDLRKRLCRLEVLQSEVVPSEQAAIGQAAPLVQGMRRNVEDAIRYPGTPEEASGASAFKTDFQSLDTAAHTLARTMDTDDQTARVQNEQMYLEKNAPILQRNLGMTTVFGK